MGSKQVKLIAYVSHARRGPLAKKKDRHTRQEETMRAYWYEVVALTQVSSAR